MITGTREQNYMASERFPRRLSRLRCTLLSSKLPSAGTSALQGPIIHSEGSVSDAEDLFTYGEGARAVERTAVFPTDQRHGALERHLGFVWPSPTRNSRASIVCSCKRGVKTSFRAGTSTS